VRKIGHKKTCYSLEGELIDISEVKGSLSNRDPYD
jgi:hypothetical protein